MAWTLNYDKDEEEDVKVRSIKRASSKEDKKNVVRSLRKRLMAQVKKKKQLKGIYKGLMDENRDLTIALAKKRGETMSPKKPSMFRKSGKSPSYSYASRSSRTSITLMKTAKKKAEMEKAKEHAKIEKEKAEEEDDGGGKIGMVGRRTSSLESVHSGEGG